MTGKDPDLSKVSTPRCTKVLSQHSWKHDMKELAFQLELELGLAKLELEQERELNARLEEALTRLEAEHDALLADWREIA